MTRADQGRGVGRGACRGQQGFLEEKNEGMRERQRQRETGRLRRPERKHGQEDLSSFLGKPSRDSRAGWRRKKGVSHPDVGLVE